MRACYERLKTYARNCRGRHSFAANSTLVSDHSPMADVARTAAAEVETELGETPTGGAPRRRGKSKKIDRGAVSSSLVITATFLLGVAAFAVAVQHVGRPSLERAESLSISVLDADDRLLRVFTTADGRWRLPLEIAETDPRYIRMLVAYEDRRFHSHHGVDPLAIGRAIGLFARHGRILSGGSTLTMQVSRLLEGEHARSGAGKIRQMLRAWQLERQLSKPEILRLYLRLAPFGGNIEGVRAASLAYFGKEPRRLSVAEAALLVAVPQSPKSRRPDRHPAHAKLARDRVIARALSARVITLEEAQSAKREPVPQMRREFPRLAPHLADAEIKRSPDAIVHRLTLNRDVQAGLETLALEHASALGAKLSVAMLAVDHGTGRVIAHVGSAGYLDQSRQGAVDMTDAVRSPGSTLKPLIYGLAFESGIAHPETLIEDRPTRFGLYHPKNFDEDFHGTVTIREALSQSLNIPAVKVLAAVGPSRLVGRMRRIQMQPEFPGKGEPTLAVALGGVGLKLTDLAMLYASLARGGTSVTLTHRRTAPLPSAGRGKSWGEGASPVSSLTPTPSPAPQAGGELTRTRRLLSPVAAWYVADILMDAPPPANAKGGRIAYKTGTSYGYRDAWAAGFDGRTTVVVWVGRPDGSATPGMTGRGAAAPILFDAFARLGERPAPLAGPPPGALRVSTGNLPPPLRRFKDAAEEQMAQGPFLEPPVQIAFPPDRADLETDGPTPDGILLKADGGALPLTWLVDGEPLPVEADRRDVLWQPQGRGFAKISVIDAKGRTDRVGVRVK